MVPNIKSYLNLMLTDCLRKTNTILQILDNFLFLFCDTLSKFIDYFQENVDFRKLNNAINRIG